MERIKKIAKEPIIDSIISVYTTVFMNNIKSTDLLFKELGINQVDIILIIDEMEHLFDREIECDLDNIKTLEDLYNLI